MGVRAYGLAGLLGVLAFAASLIALHVLVLDEDIDWTRHYVSAFANGRLGWVFVFGATLHGSANLALSRGLRRSLAPGPLSTVAVLLFSLAAVGFLVAALFPTDPAGRATAAGFVHRLATTASFPTELIALFLFSTAFAASRRWRGWVRVSFASSGVAAVAMAALALAVLRNQLPGLAERVALASFMVWELGVSWELLFPGGLNQRESPGPERADSAR